MNAVHFRRCLAFLFMVFSSSVDAAPISLTLSMPTVSVLGNTNSPRPPINFAPNTLMLQTFKNSGLSEVTFDELRITGLTPDSVDRMLNYKNGDPQSYQWTITAANAADFGVDWLAFQNHLNEAKYNEVRTYLSFAADPSPPANPTAQAGTTMSAALRDAGVPFGWWATGVQLHEVKISIDYYFWHDILEGLRGVKMRADIFADATAVPEPVAILLVSVSIGFLCVMVPRKRYQPKRP
jgi:hypothetical protein